MNKILLIFSVAALSFSLSCSNDAPKKVASETKEVKIEKRTEKAVVKDEPQAAPIPTEQIAKAKEIIAGVSDADVAAVDAKAKFNMLCSICHGTNGELGVGGAKNLAKSDITLVESVAQVYHGRGTMTAYKGLLKDAEIVAISKYIEAELKE